MNHRLTLDLVEEANDCIAPEFRNSPQYTSEPLSQMFGCELILKIETLNPIRSFKARGTDYLIHNSDDRELACASAGNFGQAMAYSCRRKNIKLTVFASVSANPLKIERMKAFGANVVLFGNDFDTAKDQARKYAAEKNIRFVEDSLDIETLAGAGTIGLELLTFSKPIDFLLVPLGNGALINGIALVFKHHSPSTKIIAVQAAGAPAMVESWRQEKIISHESVNTIADGIAVRRPVPQALIDMKGLIDDAVLVNEESIIKAMRLLHTRCGVVAEPSGGVGLAAIIENSKLFTAKTVATLVCGGNLTEEQMKEWLL